MRLYVFTADWCPGCVQVKKSGVIDKFREKHPEVKVKEVDADSTKGERLMGAWEQEEIPAFIFTTDDFDERSIGDDSDSEMDDEDVVLFGKSAGTLADVERIYQRAQKEEAKR